MVINSIGIRHQDGGHAYRRQLEDLQPLLAEGFITRTELERAEQQRDQAAEELILARRRRDALMNFGRPLELSQARSEAQASQETLRQLESANSYRLAQKEVDLRVKEVEKIFV